MNWWQSRNWQHRRWRLEWENVVTAAAVMVGFRILPILCYVIPRKELGGIVMPLILSCVTLLTFASSASIVFDSKSILMPALVSIFKRGMRTNPWAAELNNGISVRNWCEIVANVGLHSRRDTVFSTKMKDKIFESHNFFWSKFFLQELKITQWITKQISLEAAYEKWL